MFIAYLGKENLSHKTIKSYIAAIRHMHIAYGLQFHGISPRTHLIIRGIRRVQGEKQLTRLPVTPDILRAIKAVFAAHPADYANRMYWAAVCLAFFGFLRCGEFTVSDSDSFDPSVHLSVEDVAFDNASNPSSVSVIIKASKTDPFRQGVTLYLGKTDKDLCPVLAMSDYLCIRGALPGPLFRLPNGQPLRRKNLIETVRVALTKSGFNASHYSGHSFRIGAATTAAKNGIQDNVIKMLGRWESSAYQLYIRTPRSELSAFSGVLLYKGAFHPMLYVC